MKNIVDKKSLNDLLENSNLQFFSSGVLNVNDPLFITHWKIDELKFHSKISYASLDNEEFVVPFGKEDIPRSWNQFGINQSFDSEEFLNAPYHRNKHIELHYVKSGTFMLKVNQTMIQLQQGDVCMINPHCYHSDILQGGNLELYIVGVNEDALQGCSSLYKKYPIIGNSFSSSGHQSEYVILRSVSNVEKSILKLEENIKNEYVDCLIDFMNKLFENEYQLVEEYQTSRNTMLFEEIRIFIDRNYQTVSLEDLEFYFNFSKDHISRIIKDGSGFTFKKYVQRVRLEEAKRLLIESDASIKEIMRLVGYKNETHFYRLFSEYTGVSPNKFRENN